MVLLGTTVWDGVSVMVGVLLSVPGFEVIEGASGVPRIGVGRSASVCTMGDRTVSVGGEVCSKVARPCVAFSVCVGDAAGNRDWQPAAARRINVPVAKKQYKFLRFTKDAPENEVV